MKPTVLPIANLTEYLAQTVSSAGLPESPTWYRGVGDGANHRLVPRLYRHPTKSSDLAALLVLEAETFHRFGERAVPFTSASLDDPWDRMFLMQHHGCPTRLLDWSESPLVAFFFALTSVDRDHAGQPMSDPAVWALRPCEWNGHSPVTSSAGPKILCPSDDDLEYYRPVLSSRQPWPIAMYGTHNSARIMAQRGVFTVFGYSIEPMEAMFESAGFAETTLRQYTLAASHVDEALKDLRKLGLTDSVLFPDLDGLGREFCRCNGYE